MGMLVYVYYQTAFPVSLVARYNTVIVWLIVCVTIVWICECLYYQTAFPVSLVAWYNAVILWVIVCVIIVWICECLCMCVCERVVNELNYCLVFQSLFRSCYNTNRIL